MLTTKQEKFVNNLLLGMTQREAYKNSYNAKNMKDETIDNEASKIFNNPEATMRYNELKKMLLERLTDETIMSAKERMKWLSDVVNGVIKEKVAIFKSDTEGNDEMIEQEFPSKLAVKLKAIDTLNKMDGQYTEKVKIETEKPFEVNIKVVK